MHIAVVNGPNLNLLGTREPEVYGTATLDDIERAVRARAEAVGAEISWYQTNHEGEFVEIIQSLATGCEGALINAAAFTHTSVAIRDAIQAVDLPFVEVHLSNIFAREAERRHSKLADLAIGLVAGFGLAGYEYALDAIVRHAAGRGA